MVKASELRLGNYVSYNWYLSCDDMLDGEEPINVALVTIGVMHDIENGNKPMYKDKPLYGPIELSEEWLIKFGFNGDSIFGSQTLYKSDNVEIWAYRNDGKFIVDNIKRKIVHIQYVHQLQNLFFALTGRELELTK